MKPTLVSVRASHKLSVSNRLISSSNSMKQPPFQRRIRHITAIQVRNLTPFPVRDAFASALAQPSEQSQFTAQGHLSDDLDVTLSRRRSRRISSNSINTLWSMRSEEGSGEDGTRASATDPRGKRKVTARVSFSGGTGMAGTTSGGHSATWNLPSSSAPTIRSPNRHRTASLASSINSPFAGSSSLATATAPVSSVSAHSFLTMLPDHSQSGLEKVIKSRLVETFIAVMVPPIVSPLEDLSKAPSQSKESPSHSRPATPSGKATPPSREIPSRHTSRSSPLKPSEKSTSHSVPSSPRQFSVRSPSTPKPSLLNGKSAGPSTSTKKASVPASSPKTRPKSLSPTPSTPVIPNYLSQIHRPSTNPSFSLDAGLGCDFAEWTDLSADRLKIELWGKVGVGWRGDSSASANTKGKEKEKDREDNDGEGTAEDTDWKILEEWNINLADLVPVPADVCDSLGVSVLGRSD